MANRRLGLSSRDCAANSPGQNICLKVVDERCWRRRRHDGKGDAFRHQVTIGVLR